MALLQVASPKGGNWKFHPLAVSPDMVASVVFFFYFIFLVNTAFFKHLAISFVLTIPVVEMLLKK